MTIDLLLYEDMCLVPDIDHDYEFITADGGNCYWKCNLCGRWTNEIEDSQP